MTVLVLNCGSTSIKACVIDTNTGDRIGELRIQRLKSPNPTATVDGQPSQVSPATHDDAIREFLPRLIESVGKDTITAIGHRVVHGGTEFTQPTLIDDLVFSKLQDTITLAPLHNPPSLDGISAAKSMLPSLAHVAVFDTAFHATLPTRASTYAIPRDLAAQHGIRKYGFHGTSHRFVASQCAAFLGEDIRDLRLITCHLGGGCSVCAVEYGRSVETSMGMTPLAGLTMATRSGDIDPGAVLHLMRREAMSLDEVDRLLNRESGLLGLTGGVSDMRDIESSAASGDESSQLAIQIFCHRVRKCVGAYAAVMGGVDAIVFTAGIGQNSAAVRHHVTQRLEFLGARLDEQKNRELSVDQLSPVATFSQPHSRVKLLCARTDESWEIARETVAVCSRLEKRSRVEPSQDKRIPVAISARHVHLTQETVEALFGEGHELTPLKPLSQPGQFAAKEQVTLVGPKRRIEGVRVLGPTRGVNQIEISRTDEFRLGIDAPIRASGDVKNTPGITMIGDNGRAVSLDCGVICAWRHIHMTPDDATAFGVQDRDVVEVEVGKPGVRSLTFGDVLVRVKPTYQLEMHIDTDEGNAAELDRIDEGEIQQTVGEASRLKKSPSQLA